MEEPSQIQEALNYVISHWAFFAFLIGMIFEIPKLKLRPFTRLLGLVGRIVNKDVNEKLNKINCELDEVKRDVATVKADNEEQLKLIDMNDASRIRTTILDFANSLRQQNEHTEEEYIHIIELNDQYQEYVAKYKLKNGRFEKAYEFILARYTYCIEHNSFTT